MIRRTYQCPECNHRMQVDLTMEQWNDPPPSCAMCDARTNQDFSKPPGIGGSVGGKARAIAEDIIANDYHVANINFANREGGTPKVRYKDQSDNVMPASFAAARQTLQQAIDLGRAHRQTRYDHGPQGNALDVLKGALETGEQPDLIAASKRRAIKVW